MNRIFCSISYLPPIISPHSIFDEASHSVFQIPLSLTTPQECNDIAELLLDSPYQNKNVDYFDLTFT